MTITGLFNHFLQITLDRANCMLFSFLAQVNGIPKGYSITYLRWWMAIHLAQNVKTLSVNIFYMLNTCSHYRDFPGKVIKVHIETSNLCASVRYSPGKVIL